MSFCNNIVLNKAAQAPAEKNGASLTYLIRTFGGPGSPCWKSHHPKRLCWSWCWLLVIPRLPHSPPLSGCLLPGTRGERVREAVVHRGEGSRGSPSCARRPCTQARKEGRNCTDYGHWTGLFGNSVCVCVCVCDTYLLIGEEGCYGGFVAVFVPLVLSNILRIAGSLLTPEELLPEAVHLSHSLKVREGKTRKRALGAEQLSVTLSARLPIRCSSRRCSVSEPWGGAPR